MDESLIEHIDNYDFTPKAITKGFSRAYGILRKKSGYSRDSKNKRHLKRITHRRVRQYFRNICAGKRVSFRPTTGWHVL